MQNRKATYALYPSKSHALKIHGHMDMHNELWNAALQERIDAWQKHKISISYQDQCKSLTRIRNDPDLKEKWASVNCSSQQVTLNRLNKAFNNFFRRLKNGENPGFPRFKTEKRMAGFGFKGHGDGWSFKPNLQNNGKPDDFGNVNWGRHGVLYIKGVGHIKARGQVRAAGVIKSCEMLCQNGKWFVSLTLECAEIDLKRERTANQYMAVDWGVTDLLTIAKTSQPLTTIPNVPTDEVTYHTIENPRWYKTSEVKSIALSQAIDRKQKFSKRQGKARNLKAKFEAQRARKRHDYQHKLSAKIAATCVQFVTEDLDIKSMTSTTKDTYNKNTQHREILDTAPGALFNKIAYKVLETGGQYLIAPTKVIKPSQTCPQCGQQHKKTLAERIHICKACTFTTSRDEAAALVVLYWLMGILPPIKKEKMGRNLPFGLKPRNHNPIQGIEWVVCSSS